MFDDVHAQIEVSDQPANDGELLVVLLAEDGEVGLQQAEEAGDDGGDAVEVPGAGGAAEARGEPLDVDGGGVARGVQGRRHEEQVHTRLFAEGGVALGVSRVAVEVLARTELQRIDENADHKLIAERAGEVHQRGVPGVQEAHGRHEADPTALAAQAGEQGLGLVRVVDRLHPQ